MPGYWVTFRFSDQDSPQGPAEHRRKAFLAVFSELTGNIWAEPTAFIVFEAPVSIVVVAAMLQETIDRTLDMFLLHEVAGEDAILCGHYADADILLFMPHLKTLV